MKEVTVRKRVIMSKHFHESRQKVINVTTLHLRFSYWEQRLRWVQRNALFKSNLL